MKIYNYYTYFVLMFLMTILVSCDSYLEVEQPHTTITRTTVFANETTAKSAMLGIYASMIGDGGFASGSFGSISILSDLSSDILVYNTPGTELSDFNTNSLLPSNSLVSESLWAQMYKCIYLCNSVIEGAINSGDISVEFKNQIYGEALFVRAFCYFYLVNLFGDVPLITSTDYRINRTATRLSRVDVLNQIELDLLAADSRLPVDYTLYNDERVRPNKYAAEAMLARLYLYEGRWAEAETFSTNVIDQSALYEVLSNFDDVFGKNSKEAIWQLMPIVGSGINTWEGYIFILDGSPGFTLLPQFVGSFDENDKRLINWVGEYVDNEVYYYPYKYKVKTSEDLTEYSMVLRVSEQYLIRSEARSNLNKVEEAIDDLDVVRRRAGVSLIKDTDSDINANDLLLRIADERKWELFSEWGHRWFDLKRTNQVNDVLNDLKSPHWIQYDTLYPIPQSERVVNVNLSQNDGY